MTPGRCVLCGAKEFNSGLCLDCIAPPLLLAQEQTTKRKLHGCIPPMTCVFCCRTAVVDVVRIFDADCHWVCMLGWASEARRERLDRRAARAAADAREGGR